VVAALAQAKKSLAITFITHAAHQNLQIHLSEAGVSFISISSPPVVPSPRSEGDYLFGNEITGSSDSPHKRSEEEEEEEGYSLFIVELDTQGQGLSHS
jgi:F420-dependent methylenetetrahydromethanopterin dehydrogenase